MEVLAHLSRTPRSKTPGSFCLHDGFVHLVRDKDVDATSRS